MPDNEHQHPIEWRSDGPVLHLADGSTVRPVLEGHANEQTWTPFSVDERAEYAVYGPETDDGRAYLGFSEVGDDE